MSTPPMPMLEFVRGPLLQEAALGREPASAASVARFEQLMYAPDASRAHLSSAPHAIGHVERTSGIGNLLQVVEQMSGKWHASQKAVDQLANRGTLNMGELMLLQRELLNSTVNVEISSKATGLLENGVQSIMNRNQ
ncbi:MAG TPA: hypothetical protein VIT67_12705 [Povalibacter sp.]